MGFHTLGYFRYKESLFGVYSSVWCAYVSKPKPSWCTCDDSVQDNVMTGKRTPVYHDWPVYHDRQVYTYLPWLPSVHPLTVEQAYTWITWLTNVNQYTMTDQRSLIYHGWQAYIRLTIDVLTDQAITGNQKKSWNHRWTIEPSITSVGFWREHAAGDDATYQIWSYRRPASDGPAIICNRLQSEACKHMLSASVCIWSAQFAWTSIVIC